MHQKNEKFFYGFNPWNISIKWGGGETILFGLFESMDKKPKNGTGNFQTQLKMDVFLCLVGQIIEWNHFQLANLG